MCRLVAFAGSCPICTEYFSWEDLSQELSCLEAKNNGIFGDCRKGIQIENHDFDQECDTCTKNDAEDEGVEIDIDIEEGFQQQTLINDTKGKDKKQTSNDERNRKRQRTS